MFCIIRADLPQYKTTLSLKNIVKLNREGIQCDKKNTNTRSYTYIQVNTCNKNSLRYQYGSHQNCEDNIIN